MNHPSDEVAANGPTSLTDRVKELRLTGKLDGGPARAGGTAWLPWVLCAFLAIGWAGYAHQVVSHGPVEIERGRRHDVRLDLRRQKHRLRQSGRPWTRSPWR